MVCYASSWGVTFYPHSHLIRTQLSVLGGIDQFSVPSGCKILVKMVLLNSILLMEKYIWWVIFYYLKESHVCSCIRWTSHPRLQKTKHSKNTQNWVVMLVQVHMGCVLLCSKLRIYIESQPNNFVPVLLEVHQCNLVSS